MHYSVIILLIINVKFLLIINVNAEFTDQKPLQIVDSNSPDTFLLNDQILREILLQDDIKERYVCVVSIAGGFREGKSFLLNFLLRYLHVKYTLLKPIDDWLNSKYGRVEGFSWRGGSQADTTGIVMWSKVFLTELNTREEVAIILLDTQGAFDNLQNYKQAATIFTLSTLISSVQIYNVMRNLGVEQIRNLKFFADYGEHFKLNDDKPFQDLLFLIRDWERAHEKPYGIDGGDMLIKEVLTPNNDNNDNDESMRLCWVFEHISSFLMPHPGQKVAESADFIGDMNDVSIYFKENVRVLAAYLLNEENLKLKKINGKQIRAKELVYYLEEYMHLFNTDQMPNTESVLIATQHANFKVILDDSLDIFKDLMSRKEYFDSDLYQSAVNQSTANFLSAYKKSRQNEKMFNNYKQKLDNEIAALALSLKKYFAKSQEKLEIILDLVIPKSMKLYTDSMDALGALYEDELRIKHLLFRSKTLEYFDSQVSENVDDPDIVKVKKNLLIEKIDAGYFQYVDVNFVKWVKFYVGCCLAGLALSLGLIWAILAWCKNKRAKRSEKVKKN